MERELLTLEQVANLLQVKYCRAAEMARIGLIPVVRLGRQVRVCPLKLEAFVANGGKPLAGGWKRTHN